MYMRSISQAEQLVKALTYQAKHRHQINWDGTMHESQRSLWAVITGLMLAYFIFAGMTM